MLYIRAKVEDFYLYLRLGFDHIFNYDAYDHLIYVLVIIAPFRISQLKQILILLTGFTLGHSLTLALASLNIIPVAENWIEFLIPVTIFLTAFLNLVDLGFRKRKKKQLLEHNWLNYSLAVVFGLIHGLGFSNNLRPLLSEGENLLARLFSFNIGIEVGQIVIAVFALALLSFTVKILKIKHNAWNFVVSLLVLILSFNLMIQTRFW